MNFILAKSRSKNLALSITVFLCISACNQPDDYQLIFLKADTSHKIYTQYFGIKNVKPNSDPYDYLQNYFSSFKPPFPNLTYQFLVFKLNENSDNYLQGFSDTLHKYQEIFGCVNIEGRIYFTKNRTR